MHAQKIYPAEAEDQGQVEMSDISGKSDMSGKVTRALPTANRGLVALPPAQAFSARKLHVALVAARLVMDGFLLVAAFALAHWLRYEVELGRNVVAESSELSFSFFYTYVAAFVVMGLLAFHARGMYALPRGAAWFDFMRVVVSASLVTVAALTLGALFFNTVLPSRGLFLLLWVCTVAIFAVERFVFRRLRVALWRRGINIRKAVVVGTGLAGQRIMKDIVERSDLGYRLTGYVSDVKESPGGHNWRVPLKVRNGMVPQWLGTVKDIERIICGRDVHEVIVALPATHHAQILNIIDSCRACGVDFKLVPDLFEMRFNEVRIDALNGVPLIGVKDVALQGFNLLVKRVLDVTLAVGSLVLAAIPMLIIAAAVKLNSHGPVFFQQKRVGKGGEEFTCYKFRSMYEDAEQRLAEIAHLNEADGPIFKVKNDPRLTPVGKFLRRTSLDELPQLFNILKGEMSWVGPRPPLRREVDQYSDWHLKRLDVTPGLTGLWQVSGRSDLSFEEMVKLDIYYAENWSLAMDAAIILKTIPAVVKRQGAY
jgi:exopolysaccharide biosynthesis polyprenyl glycosylphosphotransferase